MKLRVELGENSYDINIEHGIIKSAQNYFNLNRKVLVVTDDGVPQVYAKTVCDLCKTPVLAVFPQGEQSKNIDTIQMLCKLMLENGFSRKDAVVAVGGGVAGDMAGFAAAIYMRGIDFYNIPTTMLSMVDSSVGGKTAIDFCGIKNILGAFHQPKGVLIDPDVLKTLDNRQFACGCAEAIKMSATCKEELFRFIEENGIKGNEEKVIFESLKIKADVISKDEKESSLRKVLNFGHTLGHGIESTTGLLHGECVALGMLPMTNKNVRNRLKAVLSAHGLPTTVKADRDAVISASMHDKKAKDGGVDTVLVDEIGSFRFEFADIKTLTDKYGEEF